MHCVGSNQQKKQPTSSPPGHVLAPVQSLGQFVMSSPVSQIAFPHTAVPVVVQSPGQFAFVSAGAVHVPSPHVAQSPGHVIAVSPVSHIMFPHTAIGCGMPQSLVHVDTSLAAHTPSPHTGALGASGMGCSCGLSLPVLAHAQRNANQTVPLMPRIVSRLLTLRQQRTAFETSYRSVGRRTM
jgi:hypothetical protein